MINIFKLRTIIHQKIPERFKNWETQPKRLLSRIYKELLQVSEKTTNNSIGKGYEWALLNKYIKKYSILSVIREMQIKATVRKPIKLAKM